MGKLLIIVVLLFLFYVFYACEKQENQGTGSVTVYTLSNQSWSLIIDGKEYGKIKKATQMPVCGDPGYQNITLATGNYKFVAKSLDGHAWDMNSYILVRVEKGQCKQVRIK